MAITVEINAVDVTSYLVSDSLSISQGVEDYVKECSLQLLDEEAALTLVARQSLEIVDGSDTLFYGTIAIIETDAVTKPNDTRTLYTISGQDAHYELERRTVTYELYEDGLNSDLDIIDDLFATYYSSGIDYATYVTGTPLDPAMEELELDNVSLREALAKVCERSGGRYYVHWDPSGGTLYFHYFETESNAAAYSYTDDNPNDSTTFGFSEMHATEDATQLVNAIYMQGEIDSAWDTDATSISTYGRHEASINDQSLKTQDAVDDKAAAFLAENKDPKGSYELVSQKGDGLRAGMQVDVTWGQGGLSAETLNINHIEIYTEGDITYYKLSLGDQLPDWASTQRTLQDAVDDADRVAHNVAGPVFDTDPPATPSFGSGNITSGVTVDGDGKQVVFLQVTWGSVGDSDLAAYQVNVSLASDYSGFVITRDHANDGDRVERFMGLLGNTTYYVRVRAYDDNSNYSPWSTSYSHTTAQDTTPPAQVTSLTAASSRTLVGLSWAANTEADLSHYEIQRAPDVTGSPGTWATIAEALLNYYIDEDFTDPEISGGDTFWYRVRAVDTSGNDGTWATQTSVALDQIDGEDHIAARTIVADRIGTNELTATEIATGAIDTDELAAGSVTAAKCTIGTLSAITADMGTLTAGSIEIGSGVPFTGFKINASYIVGVNAGVNQFYVDSSDGKAYCGGGEVTLDASGITIEAGGASANKIQWDDSATAYTPFTIYASVDGSGNTSAQVNAEADGATATSTLTLSAAKNPTGSVSILLSPSVPEVRIVGADLVIQGARNIRGSEALGCRVGRETSGQSINTGTVTALSFNTEYEDTDGCWASSPNPSRLTATEAGRYQVSASIEWPSHATAKRAWVAIRKNGTDYLWFGDSHSISNKTVGCDVSGPVNLAATDYVEICVYQDSGVTLATSYNVPGSNYYHLCSAAMWRLA